MILDLLAVGTIGFWIVLAVGSIVMNELVDNGQGIAATLLAVGLVFVFTVFGNLNLIELVKTHPEQLIIMIIGYFVLGTGWAVAKWYFFLQRIRRTVLELKEDNTEVGTYAFNDAMCKENLSTAFPPRVKDFKGRIIGWMSLWPASMVWTVINDPIRRVFVEIYNCIGGMLQNMSNKMFADLVDKTDKK
jgi:hypothetical protein